MGSGVWGLRDFEKSMHLCMYIYIYTYRGDCPVSIALSLSRVSLYFCLFILLTINYLLHHIHTHTLRSRRGSSMGTLGTEYMLITCACGPFVVCKDTQTDNPHTPNPQDLLTSEDWQIATARISGLGLS